MLRLVLIFASLAFTASAAAVDFLKDVQPIFRTRCSGCHGAAMQQSGFRLDERDAARKGGYSGAVIVPGNSGASALIHRVTGAPGLIQMPPAGRKLTPEEIGILKTWIDEGAAWPPAATTVITRKPSTHWAFQPVLRPAVPPGAQHPIDAFVLARLKREAVQPAPAASKSTQLRRLSLDLIGLPPSPAELSAFLADRRPDAYERQVDRLLASPHYGEKWARHWLDLARYADSDGYEKDWVRPHAWRYREWVIQAFNQDMPYDRFTREQLAGDLLPAAGVEQRVATGFHRNTLINREGGVDSQQFRFENTVDRASTVATVWLGLTMGCAQCHDHKYDPISQRDFFAMFAFFDPLDEVDIDAPVPGELGPWLRTRAAYNTERQAILDEYRIPRQQAVWEKEMLHTAAHAGERTDWDLAWDCLLKLTEGGDGEKIMRTSPDRRTARENEILTDHFVRNYHFAVGRPKYNELKFNEADRKLRELYARHPQLSRAQAVAARLSPQATRLRVRGDYKNPGIEVTPNTPAFLGSIARPDPTRLDLADWLVSKQNPLTARVAVNRIWQEYFGRGLVLTSEDFGTQGAAPTHRELLDWLAAEFRDTGWSMKRIHRLIVTSATYRQSSHTRPELSTKDPANTLLARQNRLRLPAELIRDAALSVSGLLYPAIGGPSIRPEQPAGVAELAYNNSVKWVASAGQERYRRGLYIHFQRTTPYPLLSNFDAPKSTVTACRRQRSNTPLQALNLLNDPVFLEAARALRERLRQAPSFAQAVTQAYLLTVSREPAAAEVSRLTSYFEQQKAAGGEDAAWTGLCSVLLNLDEFMVRE